MTVKLLTLLVMLVTLFAGGAFADPAQNREIVATAMNELFVQRDTTAIERYWGAPYIQHNPTMPNGTDFIPDMVNGLPPFFKYEAGMMIAEGDLVMAQGRYTGFGPEPMVVIDIFRLEDGKIVEHWDVMQQDVPAEESANGNPMFTPAE